MQRRRAMVEEGQQYFIITHAHTKKDGNSRRWTTIFLTTKMA
jgi:hypothetical protein